MRNLTNGGDTNLIITNNYVARLPIEQTQATSLDPVIIGLKGITGFTGSAGNVLKSNSANNALEWATDNNEIITATLPLLKTGSDISLKGITGFTGSAGNVLKSNSANNALEWATDTDTTYTGTAPIVINGTTITYNNDTAGTFKNKIFGDMTIFNNALSVKSSGATVSGYVRFYEALNNGTDFIDLHIQGNSLTNSINVYLPNSQAETILVGKDTTDTLTNKTITSFIGGSTAVITAPSTTGTLALVGETSNWSVNSNIISPDPTTVNRLKLFGTDTAVYGDITNPLSPNFGYINTGAFYDLRANNCASETFIVSKFYGSPVQYAQTTLTCSQGENLLLSGNSIAEFYDQDNSISWIQDASLSNQRVLTFFSPIQSGNTSYCCAFKNATNATNYPMIKNNNGDFVLHMRGVGDYLQLTTAGVLNTWSHTVNGTLKVSNKIVMIGSACSITGDTIANPFIPGQFYISYISSNLIYSADITVKLLRVADVNNVGNYFESQLTCVNNRLKINTPVDITGALTTTGDFSTGVLIVGGTTQSGTNKLTVIGSANISSNLRVVSEFRGDDMVYGRYFRIDGTTGYFETYNEQPLYFGTDLNLGSTYFYYSSSAAKMVSSGDWTTFSDERLKTDIQTGDDINKEMADYFDKIDINKYGYIPQYAISKNMTADQRAYGFIAQQVESVYPQGVSNSGKGVFPSVKSDYEPKIELDNVKVISKESINMLLWGKIKDLDKTVKSQQMEIDTYKLLMDKLINAPSFKSFKDSLV
jgi:hypothetical protein